MTQLLKGSSSQEGKDVTMGKLGSPGEARFDILAASVVADDRTRLLKDGETFAVFDRYGDIHASRRDAQGLYHEGTRFLSILELRLANGRPLLLGSTDGEDNAIVAVDLTNPDVMADGQVMIPRSTLHLFRTKFLSQGTYFERIRIVNYGLMAIETTLSLRMGTDFADIFEVRGQIRKQRGTLHEPVADQRGLVYRYDGLDGISRYTHLELSPLPAAVSPSTVMFHVRLRPKEEATYFLTISCSSGMPASSTRTYDRAQEEAQHAMQVARVQETQLSTSNDQFNDWLARSQADLHMMMTQTPQGLYPYAGVPWFSAPFGRDGIITALELLWVNPLIARGVLGFLAANQATESNPEQDAEPGKILHEARKGEMANLGEIPFGRYYGSVDSTPLFVLLAGAYYQRTGDLEFLSSLWPSITRALEWIDTVGDSTGDGFVTYARRSTRGLVHQGWKDSSDSVFHADGSMANGPIALCEVQGYVYAAKRGAAVVAEAIGDTAKAEKLLAEARLLQDRFERAFWNDDLGSYALALDGKKQPCLVRASNAGHCLFTGIARPDRAVQTARTLMGRELFSGWGIRTLSSYEVRYSPISYHNGSIWPHDNALIADGFGQYGLKDLALQVLTGMFEAALFLDLHRLPELFCGFDRRPGEGPALYPVACAPQSWSVATIYLLVKACLGLSVNGARRRIDFFSPRLPDFLHSVQIKNLRIGDAAVDLALERYHEDVGVVIQRREGRVEVCVVK
jgi:glycogen debranching enzyme